MKKKILPDYSYVPVILVFVFNLLVYFGSKVINQNMEHHILESALDQMIPPVNFFIVFYVLAYAQWVIGFIYIGRESKKFCYDYCYGEIIAKVLCLLCFLLYPTIMVRPEIAGDGVFDALTALIYQIDTPASNLFPSIHCLESWVVARAAFKQQKTSKAYAYGMLVMTLLVFASTVLVKQHVLLDVLGGIAVFEIGFFIAKKIDFTKRPCLWTRKR